MIKISPHTPGKIKVSFPYNPDIVAKIRLIKERSWNAEGKIASFIQKHIGAILVWLPMRGANDKRQPIGHKAASG
jgi:hypothetical protein